MSGIGRKCSIATPASSAACRSPMRMMPPAARGDLLHVRHGLLENRVARRDDDHRHRLVDQRDRPVLQLPRRVALGVDVTQLLELQRALPAPADSWCRGRDTGRRGRGRWRGRASRRRARASAPRREGRASRPVRRGAPPPSLRRSSPRARPRPIASAAIAASWQVKALVDATPISGPASVGAADVGQAGNAGIRHIDDADRLRSAVLDISEGSQRVGRLARLRNHDRQPVRIDRRLAVAIFGSDVDLDRQARESLDPVLCRSAPPYRRCRRRRSTVREAASGSTGQANGFSRIAAMSM